MWGHTRRQAQPECRKRLACERAPRGLLSSVRPSSRPSFVTFPFRFVCFSHPARRCMCCLSVLQAKTRVASHLSPCLCRNEGLFLLWIWVWAFWLCACGCGLLIVSSRNLTGYGPRQAGRLVTRVRSQAGGQDRWHQNSWAQTKGATTQKEQIQRPLLPDCG